MRGVIYVQSGLILLRFTGIDHFSAASSPHVRLRHHWCTSLSSSYPLSPPHPMIFWPSSLHMSWNSSLTLLKSLFYPFFQGAQATQSGLFQMILYIFHSSSIPQQAIGIQSRNVFQHIILIISFLLPAFVWCQLSSSPNIQIHRLSYFLSMIYTNNLSASMTTLPHSTWDISLNFCQPLRILAVTEQNRTSIYL